MDTLTNCIEEIHAFRQYAELAIMRFLVTVSQCTEQQKDISLQKAKGPQKRALGSLGFTRN